MVMFSL